MATAASSSPSPPNTAPASSVAFAYRIDANGIPQGRAQLDIQGTDGQWTTFDFEVDTGDYVPIMPQSAFGIFKLDASQGIPSTLEGVDGQPINVYTFKLPVRFHGTTNQFSIPIAFSTLETPLLLGWYGFLQHFKQITFDNVQKATIFTV